MSAEIRCKKLDENGLGECWVNNRKFTSRNLLPDEKAVVEVQRGHAQVIRLIEPSKDRVPFSCKASSSCGGCQLSHLSYEKEAEWKTEKIKALFPKLKVQPVLKADKITHYRNKTIATFAKIKGKTIAGQYEQGTHHVTDATMCVYQSELSNRIVKTCCRLMDQFKIQPYDEDRRKGYLRHVLIRTNTQNKALVTLISAVADFPERKKFMSELKKSHPEIETIITNVNTRSSSAVLSDKELIGYGEGYIEDVLCGRRFRISSSTFYQIHHDQTEVLYKKAIELADLKGNERVLDAYCGIGTISMILSDHVKEAVGVEINKASIRNAIMNAKLNGIKNCTYIAEDCTKYMLRAKEAKEKFDVVFLDPAREGSTPEFLNALCTLSPNKIVYISCNPETQKRDAAVLLKQGYQIRSCQPVDMFPRTLHIENILTFTK